ncbi:MAG: hypothetical protein KDA27_20570 [Candidatus Eisenbacteria bacterium]|uniref:Peptidase M1 membrane alanine aminopeptidase domain-containing protein n=1 Tax=Eiseniibacteriota bacterium TaxID=2212470 RepID=A0A956NG49_UNCEI|nr:hypothetical protein [Candidatus Eisenbacteria bacterium]
MHLVRRTSVAMVISACTFCGSVVSAQGVVATQFSKSYRTYEVKVTVDPERELLRGSSTIQVSGKGPYGYYLHPDFDEHETVLPDSIDTAYSPGNLAAFEWSGWPRSAPEGRSLTHVSQDYLLLGPDHSWYPAALDPAIVCKGEVTVSCPAKYTLVMDGDLTGSAEKYGFRRSSYEYGGVCPEPRILILTTRQAQARHVGDLTLRIVANPRPSLQVGELLDLMTRVVEFYEESFGPSGLETLTLAEAPQVFSSEYLLGSHVLGLGLRGVLLMGSEEFEGGLHAELVAHEIAHQWWGSTVGLALGDDEGGKWLMESLAELSASLFLDEDDADAGRRLRKRWTQGVRSVAQESPVALNEVTPASTDPEDVALAYTKGPAVLNLLRTTVGDDAFFAACRAFVAEQRDHRPADRLFFQAVSDESGLDLERFYELWVDGVELPRLRLAYAAREMETGWAVRVSLLQLDPSFPIEVPFIVRTAQGETRGVLRTSGQRATVTLMVPAEPISLEADLDGCAPVLELDVRRVPVEQMGS